MAAKILQAGRRPRRRRVCISKRLTISITLAGITVSGFSLWPGYMSMKYDRQALDIAVWTARKEYLEYCDKLRSNDDESFGKECLEAQQLGLPPPPVATRRKQHPSYGSDLEALTPLATEADASRPTRTSNPTGVIEHTGSRSTKPSISAPHITSNGPVEPSSVAFVGYTSDSVYASYKEWPCQSGQTWTPVKAEVRCDSSIDADLSACVEGVIYEVNTATSSVSNLACWPSWTAATAAWDATRTVISQLSTTRMLGTQRQTDISDAGTTTSLPFVLPGLSIDSVSKPRYTVSSSDPSAILSAGLWLHDRGATAWGGGQLSSYTEEDIIERLFSLITTYTILTAVILIIYPTAVRSFQWLLRWYYQRRAVSNKSKKNQ